MRNVILFLFICLCQCAFSQMGYPLYSTLKDIDGNRYEIDTIGKQTWIVSNLHVTHLNDGTPITYVPDSLHWKWNDNSYYCLYIDSFYHDKNEVTIYTYNVVKTGKLCPVGWHVPSDNDWAEFNHINKKLSYGGYWNEQFFTTGYRDNLGHFHKNENQGTFWTSSEFNRFEANIWQEYDKNSGFGSGTFPELHGYGNSVRCVENNRPDSLLAAIKNNDTIKIKKYLNIDEACNYIEYTYDKKEKKWNSMSVLQYAVTQGNINAVRLIIPCCGVNFKNHADETPLHTAARYGKFDIAKYLISQGAEVNATTSLDYDGSTPLIEACVYGHPKTATVLINNGAKVNLATENHGLPLFYTALFGYKDLAKLLIENGAKIDTGSLSPLGAACMAGDTAMISFLINNGANVNYYNGETALMEACEEGKLEAVKLLLNKGADIDQKDCEANAKTANYVHKGETALMMAIKKGHSDIVTYLIEKGANINYLDLLHESPLYKAVDANNFEIAKLLIDKGANVMDTCHGGQTLLMLACVHENIEIIKILISKKIKINVKDEHNKTALTYAREKGSKEIEEFLKQHGAK